MSATPSQHDGLYFSRLYEAVRFPIGTTETPGLRRGQRAALHAIASYFSLRDQPAVVTMPTGSGKSVVLALAAALTRARRVLVVTPSRLVRSQLADEFKTFGRIRAAGALPDDTPLPSVKEVVHRLNSAEAWADLKSYDVVVGTPMCVSPALEKVAAPPSDFFDLVLMDEAHHSPATTWSEILAAFPDARKLLVTATPFRRDRKEIKGTFIFDYPVRQAYEDGVFGTVEYRPIEDRGLQQNDVAIAKAAEDIFMQDRAAGLDHYLMVRTDSKTRAAELAKVYETNTNLTLKPVHSGLSLKVVKKTIEALRNKELDGIIAVDMLGEGFDFPNLKIAAVHSPHKSLAATLQFIGRFARTGGPTIGQAKFLAVLQEIKGAVRELYDEGSEWQEIVPMLNDERVQDELQTRNILRSFKQDTRLPVDEETKDLSLYAIRPYSHVKIYEVDPQLDITSDVHLTQGLEVKHREVSEDETAVVFITKEEVQPKWAPPGRFSKVEYDLFIVYIDRDTGLLFICTSRRRELLYRHLVSQYAGDEHKILAVDVINRVLNDITKPEAFSVGMRARMHTSAESYRIMAGTNAAKAIKPSDGRMYHRGHAMFRGQEAGTDVTIGLSSASKVWTNAYLQIPHLLQWCRHVASKLANEQPTHSPSNWDFLPMSKRIDKLPEQLPIAADWEKDIYLDPPILQFDGQGSLREASLLDCDLRIDDDQAVGKIRFRIAFDELHWPFEFELKPAPTFTPLGWDETAGPTVEWENEQVPLLTFVRVVMPTFYFADFSSLRGNEYLRAVTDGLVFPVERIEVVDWASHRIDIRAERRNPKEGHESIHSYLRERLMKEGHSVVVYDDGSGEIADFVTINEQNNIVRIGLLHAKATKEKKPGERVADVHEVCMQAVKCSRWTVPPSKLVDRLLARCLDKDEKLIAGTREDLKRLRSEVEAKEVRYQVVIVQPGISRAEFGPDTIAMPLAATEDFLRSAGTFEDLIVLGSA